jgi:FixJ family two-component response regulator
MGHDERLTLAVVDDDDDVRRALSRLLRASGHEVHLFTSAEDFEARIRDVDCVIVDVRLPGITGLELRDRLRGHEAPTPVVLITGDCDRLGRDAARPDGTPVVAKPFDADVLTKAISDAISATACLRGTHAP